jgi:cell division protein FtsI (penicillin-binding protein 3)/stage V sporulation protein D (sporulation-specific penicillin-binding protein)
MVLLERRIGLLFGLFLALLALAGARALWLAGVRGHDLSGRAAAQQVQEVDVQARRGSITDRNGVELAVSEDSATVYANPKQIRNPASVAARLAPIVHRPYQQLLQELGDTRRGFVYLARQIDADRGDAVKKLEVTGLGVETEPRRRYPHGALASQLVGAVGTDGYGLAGIEQSQERALRGADGRRRVTSDAVGEPVSIVEQKQGRAGKDVHLTLDAAIQERTEAVLKGVGQTFAPKAATALVLDPRSGGILALANWPPVNAQSFGRASAEDRMDRAVGASYEPGSTFKPVTISGALEERLITPESVFDVPPQLQVADRTIHDAEDHGYENLTVARILAQSSNIGTVEIGLRLGSQRFDRWVRRFGFGGSTGVDIPGEATGIVPHPKRYSGSSMGNLPIGQGLAVTPIQMAAAYQAIANGGVMRRPHVIATTPAPPRRVIKAATAHKVARMLEGVLGPGGTAQEAKIPGYILAGKTGTAQKPVNGGYSDTKYFASFIGFAPARRPRLLVAVMVDEPNGSIYGGVVAAPAFQKIASFALPYLKIPPG